MERTAATDVIVKVLSTIAPEIDLAAVDGTGDLQFECDLDSMDFLNLVEGVAQATGCEIPERDYGAIATLDGFTAYLVAQSDRSPAPADHSQEDHRAT